MDSLSLVHEQFNAAINFAIDGADQEGILFLQMWREGDWDGIANEFPEFKGPFPGVLKQPQSSERQDSTACGEVAAIAEED